MADFDDIELLNSFFSAEPGTPPERAWRRVRATHLRAKRISSSSLPAISGAVRNFVVARDRLGEGIRSLPVGGDVDRHFEMAHKHLAQGIDALSMSFRSSPKEETPVSDSIPPPPPPPRKV